MDSVPKLSFLASSVFTDNFDYELGTFSSLNSDIYDRLTILHAIKSRKNFLNEFKRRVIVKQINSSMTRYSNYLKYVEKLDVQFNAEDGSKIFSKSVLQRSRINIY